MKTRADLKNFVFGGFCPHLCYFTEKPPEQMCKVTCGQTVAACLENRIFRYVWWRQQRMMHGDAACPLLVGALLDGPCLTWFCVLSWQICPKGRCVVTLWWREAAGMRTTVLFTILGWTAHHCPQTILQTSSTASTRSTDCRLPPVSPAALRGRLIL